MIDHSHDYALGGETTEINGNPVCRGGHNREKTKNGWRQEREGNDVIIWISPFGQRIPVPAPAYATPDPEPEPPPDPGLGDDPPPF